jgi:hypothetical protein
MRNLKTKAVILNVRLAIFLLAISLALGIVQKLIIDSSNRYYHWSAIFPLIIPIAGLFAQNRFRVIRVEKHIDRVTLENILLSLGYVFSHSKNQTLTARPANKFKRVLNLWFDLVEIDFNDSTVLAKSHIIKKIDDQIKPSFA